MEELSIKIKIGDREYPMRVAPAEEERIRLAGKVINENLKKYKDQFGINDKQDLLAMVAFQFLVEKMKKEAEETGTTGFIFSKIDQLDKLISDNLGSD
ncbi:cell division protein ZapA [Cytophagaceae bacterium ABcell3]|nr:cell division protein ZapA [Cytophagaceae bacterium ABcell3]